MGVPYMDVLGSSDITVAHMTDCCTWRSVIVHPRLIQASFRSLCLHPGFKVAFGEIDSLPFAWFSIHFAVFSAFEWWGRKV